MQLSTNFRLGEFTRSDTAKRLGIVNECSSVEQVLNLAGGPTPSSPRVAMGSFPRVALESAPLKGHESIFNTFSKGPFRPSRGTEAHSVLLLKTSLAL